MVVVGGIARAGEAVFDTISMVGSAVGDESEGKGDCFALLGVVAAASMVLAGGVARAGEAVFGTASMIESAVGFAARYSR